MAHKKVLIIFCGGTISMSKNKEGSLEIAHGAEQFFQLEPRVVDLAEIDVHFLCNVDSADMQTEIWVEMVKVIQEKYDQYDGFVVTHGTNTLSYSASAISFAIQNLGKPVVFTGAQIPAEAISTDARNNFVNAIRVATMELGGVFVVFGSKIMLGCRSKKLSESELDAFGSFNEGDFGSISIGISINKDTCSSHQEAPVFRNGFDKRVVCITCFPGLTSDYINYILNGDTKAIIFRGFGPGDIQSCLIPSLELAREKEIPIIITTQCRGSTIMGLNTPGYLALKAGAIQAFDMSMESMSTKAMWLLAQNTPYDQFKKLFHTNMNGEINIKKIKFFINKELSSLDDYSAVNGISEI